MIQKTTFLACALGEMLIDFTMQGRNEQGQRIFAQNAGGAPANVMAAMAKLGARTAFIGKAGMTCMVDSSRKHWSNAALAALVSH